MAFHPVSKNLEKKRDLLEFAFCGMTKNVTLCTTQSPVKHTCYPTIYILTL